MALARRLVEAVLVVYVVGVVGLAAVAHLAPLTGHHLFAVRSASMAPLLDIGDLVVVMAVPPETVRAGEVITFRVESGIGVTHRVVAVSEGDTGPVFTTRGDANPGPDPIAVQAVQLEGRPAVSVGGAGFILAMLSMPIGIAALFSIGTSLLVVHWLLDEARAEEEDRALEELLRAVEADGDLVRRMPPTLVSSS